MKGCARSALLQLLIWIAVSAGVVWLAEDRCGIPRSQSIAPAAFTGLSFCIGAGLLIGAGKSLQERRRIERSRSGERPVDGRREVLTGTIHADGDPLIAPLSGVRCVAFSYDISKYAGRGRQSSLAVFYKGVAVTPSTIRTRTGGYKLLAVPVIDAPPENLDAAARRRAEEHVLTATFADPPQPMTRPQIEKQWSDDDGSYRHEVRHTKDPVDLASCILTERVIKQGAEVCVIGRYSAERGGIVADANWANETRVMTDDPAKTSKALLRRSVRYGVAGIVFGLAAGGIAVAAFGSACG